LKPATALGFSDCWARADKPVDGGAP
jgi:hypothetical protein